MNLLVLDVLVLVELVVLEVVIDVVTVVELVAKRDRFKIVTQLLQQEINQTNT